MPENLPKADSLREDRIQVNILFAAMPAVVGRPMPSYKHALARVCLPLAASRTFSVDLIVGDALVAG